MGKAPNVKLKNMSMQERIEWFRKRLLDMAGTEEVHQGKRWWVLEYQGGLCNLLQELSGGILSKSVYNDINNQMMRNGLRESFPAGAGRTFVHRVLMLEQAAQQVAATPAGTKMFHDGLSGLNRLRGTSS